jgi:tRNA-dihydrouridine synthase
MGAEDRFVERLRAIEDAGIDAITLHVRFFEDKFKRRARHELFQWATSLTAAAHHRQRRHHVGRAGAGEPGPVRVRSRA